MKKNERPTIDNPLANMGLDQIVRGITQPKVSKDIQDEQEQDEKVKRRKESQIKKNK